MVTYHSSMRGYCGYDVVAESYGSEQIWTCMVLPSTIIVTACEKRGEVAVHRKVR